MGKKGPLWWRESDWLLRGSSAANQILLRHSGPILSYAGLQSQPSITLRNSECVLESINLFLSIISFILLDDVNSKKSFGYEKIIMAQTKQMQKFRSLGLV